jgi:hypothetical protein
MKLKLYEVRATEYNGEQEYFQSKLLAAKNTRHARKIARDYFRQWYDDGDKPSEHNTKNPDEFKFICGCIRLKIKSVQRIILDDWIRMQITLNNITDMPDKLMTTRIASSSAELLEACKVLTSYTMDLLRRLDNQVNIADIEEIQHAQAAIVKHTKVITNKS